MKLIKNFALPLVLVALLAFSCKKDDDIVVQPETFTNGILIVNEGAFGSGNGSVDFKKDTSATVQSGIFNAKNNRPPPTLWFGE